MRCQGAVRRDAEAVAEVHRTIRFETWDFEGGEPRDDVLALLSSFHVEDAVDEGLVVDVAGDYHYLCVGVDALLLISHLFIDKE